MPEKDFEKQVREKMGELKLRPGEPVWDKIEKALRKEKRKRVFFVLPLVAALLLLGYTGYRLLIHTDKKKNVHAVKQLSTEKNNTELSNKNNDSILHQNKEGTTPKKSETVRANPELDPEMEKEGNVSEKTVLKETTAQKKRGTIIRNAANTNEKINNPRPVLADEPAVVDKRPDSVAVQPVKAHEPVVVDKRPDSAVVKSLVVTNPASQNKLSAFAIQIAIGVSDIRSKPLSFSKTNPNYNSTAGPITGYPQWPRPLPPSEITAGKAFSIGIEWQKAFTKRSGFSTGLRYAYFSNKIMVGTKTNLPLQLSYDALADKTLDDYYGGTQTEKFTNRYHFLELPLEYHFRFNNNKKIGFDWRTGLTLGWLVSSNELMYDTIRGGIYFHSNDLFNRTQLGFQTGISIRFKLKNNATFLAGPQAYLDLSRMTKDGFDRNRYLFAGALQARYVFPGKTKK